LIAAGSHPDFRTVSFVPTKDGTRLRSEIVIEQIRALSSQLALTPQYGGAQVVIIDPADSVNHAACNALLKTLEEPVPGRYLWLVSAFPARLPATIRSRCQRVEFRLPPHEEALAWLRARAHDDGEALEALRAARGHPGLADEWLEGEGLALRREVAEDLQAIEQGQASAVETAQRWVRDDSAALRLRHAADLAVGEASGLTDPARTRSLAIWFDKANRTRDLLRTTVRADLAIVELLMAWRGARGQGTGSQGAGSQGTRNNQGSRQ
jgi:DNA polymerase-3 subunit delta'